MRIALGWLLLTSLTFFPATAQTGPGPLAGSSWSLEAYISFDGEVHTVVPEPDLGGGPYEIQFLVEGGGRGGENHGVRLDSGCNNSWAAYATSEDGSLLTGNWQTTLNTCPGEDAEILRHFSGGHLRAASYELARDDSLRLYPVGSSVTRVLVFSLLSGTASGETGDRPTPLKDTDWTLVSYREAAGIPTPVNVPPGASYGPYTLQFSEEGGVSTGETGFAASDGCTDAEGIYATATDNTLLIGGMGITLKECSQVPASPPFISGLRRIVSYELVGIDSLRVYYESDVHHGGGEFIFVRTGIGNTAERIDHGRPSLSIAEISPNPFRNSVTIRFEIEKPGRVSLVVYDLMGRSVTSLIDGELTAGTHSVSWDGRGLAAGSYFISLSSGGQTETRQLTLLR